MIIIRVDLTDAATEMAFLGKEVASKELWSRFNDIIESFRAGNSKAIIQSTLKQIGPPTNGLLLVDEDQSKLKEYVETAIRIQQYNRGLDIGPKISIGVGDPAWHGEPYGPKSTVFGTVVNITESLLLVCPKNGIVITEGAHALLVEYPDIVRQMVFNDTMVKGLPNKQPYWYIVIGPSHSDQYRMGEGVVNEREIADLKEEVGDLNKSVSSLALSVEKLTWTVRILCWISGGLALSTILTWLTLVIVVIWFGRGGG